MPTLLGNADTVRLTGETCRSVDTGNQIRRTGPCADGGLHMQMPARITENNGHAMLLGTRASVTLGRILILGVLLLELYAPLILKS